MAFILISLILALGAASPGVSESIRHAPVLLTEYEGRYKPQYTEHLERVRLLTHQAQLEVSARLGLMNYRDGFLYPLVIRFEDDAPLGIENSLAYVRFGNDKGHFGQELVINLQELNAHPMNFDTVFTHEMTHAVMNDAVGGEAGTRLPRWLQEGLAEYVSGEGPGRVQDTASKVHKSAVPQLLFNLDGPVYGNGYPYYYLAIKFLEDKFSINSVQAIVRQLIQGKSLSYALEDATALTWTQYQSQVRDYAFKTFKDLAIPDGVNR
jgi:hypothetical protein